MCPVWKRASHALWRRGNAARIGRDGGGILMNKDSLIETLREIRFLHDIGPMHLEQIAKIARVRDYHEGDVVFRQGDAAQSVYLVVYGNVSLEICAAGTGCQQILTLGPGELLGWSSVLEQLSYTARARALETTRLVEINV